MAFLDNTLEAYTDGSSLPSPRRGGVGVRFVWIDEETGYEAYEDFSPMGIKGGTNQEMEILACTMAMEESLSLDIPASIRRLVIRTDSTYVQDHYKRALFQWPKTQWHGASGAPIENALDWKEFRKAYEKVNRHFDHVEIEWVRGKSNRHAKAVDKLAKESAKNAFNPPRKTEHVRRKEIPTNVERGSVRMEGQTFTVRIRASKYLDVHKLWRCHYEVVSEDDPDFGKADIIITERKRRLDAGHTYIVRVNEEQDNPRVEEIIREVMPKDSDDESENLTESELPES